MPTCEVRHTGSGPVVDCHAGSAKEVGADLARTALRDPVLGRKLLEQALLLNPDGDVRREIARGLAEGLSLVMLSHLAESKDGHALLERALAELKGGKGDDAWAANQIGTALKTSDLKNDGTFKKLDATSQQTVVERLMYTVPVDPLAVDNLIALAKSPGFAVASPDVRAALLSALADHPGDTPFGEGLQKLADDAAFKKLSPTEQVRTIDYYKSVPATKSYRERDNDADRRLILDNAGKVVVSQGFGSAPPFTKLAAMGALARHATDAVFTSRLIGLVNDSSSVALSDASKQVMLVDAYGSDADFANGLDGVMAGGNYGPLGGAGRAKVLVDMARLHGTQSYKALGDSEQQTLVVILGNVSAQSAGEPGNKILRNALDHIVDGSVKIGLYEEDPYVGAKGNMRYALGKSNHNGVFFNMHTDVRASVGPREDIDTLAHEMNHYLNSIGADAEWSTVDRFLDEYRAAIAGGEAAKGGPLTPAEQKAALDNLVDGDSNNYRPNWYHDKYLPWFTNLVKDMNATFAGKTDPKTGAVLLPPATFDAEQLRHAMLKSYSSDYLRKTGNLDNH